MPEADDREPEGAFFPEATMQDFKDFEAEQKGLKPWLDRIKAL